MKKNSLAFLLLISSFLVVASGFHLYQKNGSKGTIPSNKKWSERMALSVMKRNPESWKLDFRGEPKWEYTQGLVLKSIEKVAEDVKDPQFNEYIKQYADYYLDEKGNIKGYDIDDFNIDNIAPGRILFKLYDQTKDEKYLRGIQLLRKQLRWQPRTTQGGFWHKLRYPWQMWLDGLYMGSPFYAEFASRYNEAKSFDDIALQIILMEEKSRDAKTGLLYHGWDESKVQRWADPQTGTSPNFWGRAMGWYAMAIVDVLDYLPQSHPKRQEIIQILDRLTISIEKYQDKETGLWYQVLDKPKAEGNYLESSASSMFVYAIAKAVNKGYLDKSKMSVATKGYDGILKHFIEVTDQGEVNIHKACAVAGLGGQPYRDGTYNYYISEKIKTNDPKAEGPFILASLELGR